MKKAFKIFFLIVLSIVLVVSFAGCFKASINENPPSENGSINPPVNGEQPKPGNGPTNGNGNQDEPKAYDGVTVKVIKTDYPAQIESYLQENQAKETQQAFNIDNRTYIVLTMGEKTSGGYAIELKDLVLGDGSLKVYVKYRVPGKDDATTAVITYPSLVIETDKIYEGHYEIAYEIEK